MRGKAILAHAGDPTELNDALLVEARLDHVPSHRALASDERSDAEEGEGGAGGEATAEEEVGDRGEEGQTDDTTEDPVRPFPEIDRLKVLERDVLVLPANATKRQFAALTKIGAERRTFAIRAWRGTFRTRAPSRRLPEEARCR